MMRSTQGLVARLCDRGGVNERAGVQQGQGWGPHTVGVARRAGFLLLLLSAFLAPLVAIAVGGEQALLALSNH
jgi:hypothetical protein